MMGSARRRPICARASPTFRFSSSDSTTQGPAMRNGALANRGAGMSAAGQSPNRASSDAAEAGGSTPEAHRAGHFLNAFLRAHQGDDRVRAFRRELARIGVGDLAHVACELDDRRLEAEANAEERQLALAREADRLEHAFHAAHAETAGH